jgi:hypothetical protein
MVIFSTFIASHKAVHVQINITGKFSFFHIFVIGAESLVPAVSLHFHKYSIVTYFLNNLVIILSMGWEYVSELRPSAGLLFITQVTYEHGESCWIISTHEKSWFFNQSSLVILSAESSGSKARGTGKGNDDFGFAGFKAATLGCSGKHANH